MNVDKLLDGMTREELVAVLSGAARRVARLNENGSFPLLDDDGASLGYVVLSDEDEEESAEEIAELEKLIDEDGPTIPAEEALALLEQRWGTGSSLGSAELLNGNGAPADDKVSPQGASNKSQ